MVRSSSGYLVQNGGKLQYMYNRCVVKSVLLLNVTCTLRSALAGLYEYTLQVPTLPYVTET